MANIGIEAEKLDLARDQMKSKGEEVVFKEGLKAVAESDKQTGRVGCKTKATLRNLQVDPRPPRCRVKRDGRIHFLHPGAPAPQTLSSLETRLGIPRPSSPWA